MLKITWPAGLRVTLRVFYHLWYHLVVLEIKQLREMQQDLSVTLEEKQGNTQKLQQSIDIIESDIERISEIKQKVSSWSLKDLYFLSCLFLYWWWWWRTVFVVWLTNERRLALFPVGTIVDYLTSSREQDLNLRRTRVQAGWWKLCSNYNHLQLKCFHRTKLQNSLIREISWLSGWTTIIDAYWWNDIFPATVMFPGEMPIYFLIIRLQKET